VNNNILSSLLLLDFQRSEDWQKGNKVNKYQWFILSVFACLLEISAKIFSHEWWWAGQYDGTAYQMGYRPFVKVDLVLLTYLHIGLLLKASTTKVHCQRN